MSFYSGLAATASRLVERFGVVITLTKATRAEYDPTTGTFLDDSESVFTGYGVRDTYRNTEVDGTRIASGDVRVYLSVVLSADPSPGDVLTIEGERLSVVECKPIRPGATVVLYDVQTRKA